MAAANPYASYGQPPTIDLSGSARAVPPGSAVLSPTGAAQMLAPAHGHARYGGSPEPPANVAMAQQALADPYVRQVMKQQAAQLGGVAKDAATHYGKQGVAAFQDYIQQGPQGISVLCFVGGVTISILGMMNVCNIFGTIYDPFHYILNAYACVFGFVTAILEADTDRIGMLMSPFDKLAEPVTRAQAWLHEEWKLLTRLRGRGFFYLYQGTLLVTQCVFCLMFLAGLYSVVMGVLCILMSLGMKPDIENMALFGSSSSGAALLDGDSEAGAGGFARAEAAWRQHKEVLPGKSCRELWALHKQATVGDCNEPKPEGVFNGNAKEQWRLWSSLQGMPPEEARAGFVERLRRDGVPV